MINSLAMLFLGICLLVLTRKNEELIERVDYLYELAEVKDNEIGVD